jgi:hypothetical protein
MKLNEIMDDDELATITKLLARALAKKYPDFKVTYMESVSLPMVPYVDVCLGDIKPKNASKHLFTVVIVHNEHPKPHWRVSYDGMLSSGRIVVDEYEKSTQADDEGEALALACAIIDRQAAKIKQAEAAGLVIVHTP